MARERERERERETHTHTHTHTRTHTLLWASDQLVAEESHRLWCVVLCDLETSRIGAPYIYI